ncbi:hypothetical protein GCM10011313_29810 [Mycetocola zhadangensis]|nr:hypothetical protein GCM10011313_29810 [Mycetocola zhadangensis]
MRPTYLTRLRYFYHDNVAEERDHDEFDCSDPDLPLSVGVSLLLDTTPTALSSILHWGADLGQASPDDLGHLAATIAPLHENTVDAP